MNKLEHARTTCVRLDAQIRDQQVELRKLRAQLAAANAEIEKLRAESNQYAASAKTWCRRAEAANAEIERLNALIGDNSARGFKCPNCTESLTLCKSHGLYRRTDENQCPVCRRGK